MTTGQENDMRNKSKTMAKNVVVVDDDNDFEAEADTIEELAAKEKSDVEKKIDDKKPAFEFQTVELAPDDFEDQFQVDDFSDKLDAEFGEMKSYEPEPRIEIEVEESETEEPIIEEPEAEAEEPEVESEPEAEEPEFRVAPFTTKPEKKKLDFPVFKSSLFPDYHKEVKNVENNFDEIMEEAQDKMTENMRKEAQMQKEAEELLASLGISHDSIPTPTNKE